MRVKIVDERKRILHNIEIPDCDVLKAWDAFEFSTFRKPYILKSVNYIRDHSNNRDEIVINVTKLTICGIDV